MRWHRALPDPKALRSRPGTETEGLLVRTGEHVVETARERVVHALGGYAVPGLQSTDGEVLSVLALAPAFAAALASEATFDGYVAAHEANEPYLVAVPGEGPSGRKVPGAVVRPSAALAERPSILPAGLATELAGGRTFIVHRIDQYDRGALRSFVEDLERIAAIPVGVNCYLSRNEAEGFGCHWDDHDVIVLQVAGRKVWEVRRPTHLSPKRGYVHDDLAGDPIWSGILEPGQALYIPRGWAHSVIGLDQLSVHYTVALHRPSFLEVVDSLAWDLDASPVEPAADPEGFRRWLASVVGTGADRWESATATVLGEVPTRPHGGLTDVERWLPRRDPAELEVLRTGRPVFVGPPTAGTVRLRWAGTEVELDDKEARLLAAWPVDDPAAEVLGAELLRAGLARVRSAGEADTR